MRFHTFANTEDEMFQILLCFYEFAPIYQLADTSSVLIYTLVSW